MTLFKKILLTNQNICFIIFLYNKKSKCKRYKTIVPNEYSPLVLAYLGDVVVELAVRERLVRAGNVPPEKLHEKAMLFVTAEKQSEAVERILPHLTEAEAETYKRGRNAKARVPKSASAAEYRRATGLECLFGHLYLSENKDRINELFEIAFGGIN